MKKMILVALWATVCLLFSVSAFADPKKGIPTTMSRDEPSSVIDLETVLLTMPSGMDVSLRPAPKCRWVKKGTLVTNSSIATVLTPTIVGSVGCSTCCGGGIVSVGGGVHVTSLPQSQTSGSRLVCDG